MPARPPRLAASLSAVLLAVTLSPGLASKADGQTLPEGWTVANVGQAPNQGSANFATLSEDSWAGESPFTLEGTGRGITGTADQFRFVYQRVSGNQDLVTRVASFETSTAAARAGLMVRQDLTPGAAHASILVGPATGPLFTSRKAARRRASQTPGGAGTAPFWLKLSKRGSSIAVLSSNDGVDWVPLGEETVPLKEPFYIGLAVTSGTPGERGSVTFDSVARMAVPNLSPTSELTAPAEDTSYAAPASMVIGASATDADGSVSKVDFYEGATLLGSDTTSPFTQTWTAATAGDYVLTAVATDDRGATTTSAPRTVTVTSDAPPELSRNEPADADLPDPEPSPEAQEREQERTQDAADNVTRAAAQVAADQPQPTALAAESAGAADTAPAITQPPGLPARAGAYTPPAAAPLTTTGTASSGSPSTTSPEGATADDQPSTAVTDASPSQPSTTSPGADAGDPTPDPVVNNDPDPDPDPDPDSAGQNVAPIVALTSPANSANFATPTSVTLTATASDTDGTVTRVEFYVGSTLVSTDTTSPYSFTWSNVVAGVYSLTAVAYDNQNGMTVSSARDFTVTTSPPTSSAVFTPSDDHATVDHYLLKIFVAGADPEVDVPVATLDLGWPDVVNGECTADVSSLIDALAPGSYIATVTAVSNWADSGPSDPSSAFTR